MRFYLHGSLSPSVATAVARHGHAVVESASLPAVVGSEDVLDAARVQQFEIITADRELIALARDGETKFNRVLVYLQLSGSDVEHDDAIDRLFTRYKRLSSGRLYTVTETRVKIAQLPPFLRIDMSLLVTGSIGVDTIETHAGKRDNVIGGSAVYFSYAASFFTDVRLVGVIGPDYPHDLKKLFAGRRVDTSGLETRQGSKSFRWHGSYVDDLNNAQTVQVDLNVLAEQAPKLPASYLDSKYVFLANTHPQLQMGMLSALKEPKLVVADTMNLWIETSRDDLLKLLKSVHGFVLNDGEAKLLTGKKNLIEAARDVLKLGPKFVVIKKGEHGSLMCTGEHTFVLPAYPADVVVDPTGAGDSFAAGMMGYLATQGTISPSTLRRAMAFGTVVASYTISNFSLGGLQNTTRDAIDSRWETFKQSMSF